MDTEPIEGKDPKMENTTELQMLEDINIAWDGEGSMDRCSHCGRKVSKTNTNWFHLAGTGELFPVDATDEQIEAGNYFDQGWFPIGADCAKRLGIPATHLSKSV